MIVSTINVNGIRAACKQRSTDNLGLRAWLKETAAVLAERVVAARVERAPAYALRWSDHAPVTVEYG